MPQRIARTKSASLHAPMPWVRSGVMLGVGTTPNSVASTRPPAKGMPPCSLSVWHCSQPEAAARYAPRATAAGSARAGRATGSNAAASPNPRTRPRVMRTAAVIPAPTADRRGLFRQRAPPPRPSPGSGRGRGARKNRELRRLFLAELGVTAAAAVFPQVGKGGLDFFLVPALQRGIECLGLRLGGLGVFEKLAVLGPHDGLRPRFPGEFGHPGLRREQGRDFRHIRLEH